MVQTSGAGQMNTQSYFKKIIFTELAVLLAVAAVFIFIKNLLLAGIIASMLFIFVGIYIVYTLKNTLHLSKVPTYALALVHLLVTSLIILIRVLNINVDYNSILFFGFSSATIHTAASVVYYALIGATIFDYFRLKNS